MPRVHLVDMALTARMGWRTLFLWQALPESSKDKVREGWRKSQGQHLEWIVWHEALHLQAELKRTGENILSKKGEG